MAVLYFVSACYVHQEEPPQLGVVVFFSQMIKLVMQFLKLKFTILLISTNFRACCTLRESNLCKVSRLPVDCHGFVGSESAPV